MKRLIADLRQRVPRLMAETKVPGVSLALIEGAKVRWRHCFVVKDRASGEPVDDRTIGEGNFFLQSVVARLTGHEGRAVCRSGYEGNLEVRATDIASYLQADLLTPFLMNSSGKQLTRRGTPRLGPC